MKRCQRCFLFTEEDETQYDVCQLLQKLVYVSASLVKKILSAAIVLGSHKVIIARDSVRTFIPEGLPLIVCWLLSISVLFFKTPKFQGGAKASPAPLAPSNGASDCKVKENLSNQL